MEYCWQIVTWVQLWPSFSFDAERQKDMNYLQRYFQMLSLDAFDLFPLMKLTKQIRKLADAKTTSEFSEVSINFHFGKQTQARNFTKDYCSWNLENINLKCSPPIWVVESNQGSILSGVFHFAPHKKEQLSLLCYFGQIGMFLGDVGSESLPLSPTFHFIWTWLHNPQSSMMFNM